MRSLKMKFLKNQELFEIFKPQIPELKHYENNYFNNIMRKKRLKTNFL